ncbi:MAG: HAMP domain-containing sensor histidine kinase [bacterium]
MQEQLTNVQTAKILLDLQRVFLEELDLDQLVLRIVKEIHSNLVMLDMGFNIVVLGLIDKERNVLSRTSVTQTDETRKALSVLPLPFKQIDVSLDESQNYCVSSALNRRFQLTHDWANILTPPFTIAESQMAQAAAGIQTSYIYPLHGHEGPLGVMIFSTTAFKEELTDLEHSLLNGCSDIASIAVQTSNLYKKAVDRSKDLEKTNSELVELDHIKDEFVSLTSHELRTPLTIIKNYQWMAINKPDVPLGPATAKFLDTALLSVDRLTLLVEDMLTVSHIHSSKFALKKGDVDIISLIKAIHEEYSVKATEKSFHYPFSSDTESLVMSLDKSRIQQVYINMLGNALKFTPVAGTVATTIQKLDGKLHISVTDTGPGIPADKMNQLFTKFGKIDESYKNMPTTSGTGLGLYISQEIMKLHGGEITVQSEYGKGSTFTMSLPIV